MRWSLFMPMVLISCSIPLPATDIGLDLGDVSVQTDEVVHAPDLVTTDKPGKDQVTPPDIFITDTCTPDCWIKVCGPDGCGGSCGSCPKGTVCSKDQTMCILTAVQEPLGGACGETDLCAMIIKDPIQPELRYYNPNWPACLDDQCREGPCIYGFCSRTCTIYKDTVINATGEPGSDGVEDPDSSKSDCADGKDVIFDSGFVCVAKSGANLCLPKASFAFCSRTADCPDGEACSLVEINGQLSGRCVAKPKTGQGLSQACSTKKQDSQLCETWLCSKDGCTAPCADDFDCLTALASCEGGTCAQSGLPCTSDADCSAWRCGSDVQVSWLQGSFTACTPRECLTDSDCRDPSWYCLLQPKDGNPDNGVTGRCSPRLVGGAGLGEYCNVTKGDGLPDVVCANEAYCLFHRCGAACQKDTDCSTDGSMRCAEVSFGLDINLDNKPDRSFLAPVCIYLGTDAQPCATQKDCEVGTCTPWVPFETHQVALHCMTPPPASVSIGSECGSAAWGMECETRKCQNDRPESPGWCSVPCETSDDCPYLLAVGASEYRWICEAALFDDAGTTSRLDDRYVSWCTPVPGSSSLAPCGEMFICPDMEEVCIASVRAGAPSWQRSVSYVCVEPMSQSGIGSICDPKRQGRDCGTNICAPTAIEDVGFCSRLCSSDLDCAGLAFWGASCVEHVLIPAPDPAFEVAVRECRVASSCVRCNDDYDCAKGFRCANVSSNSFVVDFRCARECETDADCQGAETGGLCAEVASPLASAPKGLAKVCIGVGCP